MPPKRQTYDVDDWIRLYESGMTYEQVGREVGFSPILVWKRLRERGIGRSTSVALRQAFDRRHAAIAPEVARRYNAGESVFALSRAFDVTRGTVAILLEREGVEHLRGAGEANRLRFLDPGERGRVAVKAHLSMGKGERELAEMLADRGLIFKRQQIVGHYNLDLACRDLAVEVHAPSSNPFTPKGRELKRCEALMRLGWHVFYVWTRGCEIDPSVADQIVAFLDEVGRNPAASRQYRVVRANGEVVASGSDKPDQIALKRATRRGH